MRYQLGVDRGMGRSMSSFEAYNQEISGEAYMLSAASDRSGPPVAGTDSDTNIST